MRALGLVKRQLPDLGQALRACCQAATSRVRVAASGRRQSRHCPLKNRTHILKRQVDRLDKERGSEYDA